MTLNNNELLILWDHTCTSTPVTLNPRKHRDITVLFKEKVVSLGCRYLENQGKKNGFFLGAVNTDKEGITILITVDKFEENCVNANCILPGDIVIPFTICKVGELSNILDNEAEVVSQLKKLNKDIGSRDEVDLAHSVKLSIQCVVQGGRCELSVYAIVNDVSFKALSIPPIPIYKSTLLNILSSQLNEASQTPKSGLLTIDSNRKVDLISETDPRVSTTSVVGLWVSSVDSVEHPFVWASCLRYISCADYLHRLCLPPKPFLLIVYSSTSNTAEFYDCLTSNGLSKMTFNLLEGYGSLTIPKIPSFSTKILRIELGSCKNIKLKKTFKRATDLVNSNLMDNPAKPIIEKIGSNIGDTPRSAPKFTSSNAYTLKPMVPDISILSDHENNSFIPRAPLKPIINNTQIAKSMETPNYATPPNHPCTSQRTSPEYILQPPSQTLPQQYLRRQTFENNSNTTPMVRKADKEYPKANPSSNIASPRIKSSSQVTSDNQLVVGVANESNSSVEITNMLKNQDEQLRNLQKQVLKLLEVQESREVPQEKISQPPTNTELSPSSSSENSNSELLNLLHHQDEQLLKLQEQVKQMLLMQNNTLLKSNSSSNCSVGVMTSIITPEKTTSNYAKSPISSKKDCSHCHFCKNSKSSGNIEESATKDMTLHEISANNSNVFGNSFLKRGDSFVRENDKNPATFYQKILNNVNQLLGEKNASFEDVREPLDSFRQMGSLYLPRLNYQTLYLKDNDAIANGSDNIDALAQKYLGQETRNCFESTPATSKQIFRATESSVTYEPQTKGVSFATKAYLDKHNLKNPSPIPEENVFGTTPKNRVLDIEKIQRQPKLL